MRRHRRGVATANEYDYHKMWGDLGMDVEAHDGLLGVVGEMYQIMYLTQENRPASTSYLDGVAANLHSGRIREMVGGRGEGASKKIIESFYFCVSEEVVTAAGAVEVGLCASAEWAPEKAERYVPHNTCPLIKGFMGFKIGRVCPYIESADLVVGESTCDGKKKAYEQFGKSKPMYIMDVPHVRNDDTKLQWRHEVHTLAARVEEEAGQRLQRRTCALPSDLLMTCVRPCSASLLPARQTRCPSPASTSSSPCRPPSWMTPHV